MERGRNRSGKMKWYYGIPLTFLFIMLHRICDEIAGGDVGIASTVSTVCAGAAGVVWWETIGYYDESPASE